MGGGCTRGVGVARRLASAFFGVFADLVDLARLAIFFFVFAAAFRLFDARGILLKPSYI